MRIRIWPIVILIIVLLILVAPAANGLLFKHHYLNLIRALNVNNQIKMTVLEYHLGWFSSDAKLSLEFDKVGKSFSNKLNPTGLNLSFTMMVDQHISHGPLVYVATNNTWKFAEANVHGIFHLPLPIESILLGSATNQGFFQVDLLGTFLNGYHLQFKIPNIHFQSPLGNLTWQGLNGTTEFKLAEQTINYVKSQITIGALTAAVKDATLSFQPIQITTDMQSNNQQIWEGSHHTVIPDLKININNPKSEYSIKNLRVMYAGNTTNNQFLNTHLQVSLGQFVSPHFDLGTSSVNLNWDKMNANNWPTFIQATQQDSVENPSQKLLNHFYLLITPNTTFSEDVSLNSSYGILTSHGQAFWPTPLGNFDDLIKQANLKINIRVSQTLVQKFIKDSQQMNQPSTSNPTSVENKNQLTQAKVDQWLQQGYLISDKNDYVVELTRENGSIKANGQIINP